MTEIEDTGTRRGAQRRDELGGRFDTGRHVRRPVSNGLIGNLGAVGDIRRAAGELATLVRVADSDHHAASTASRVFPTPAGPTSTTPLADGPASESTTNCNSSSRPTSGHSILTAPPVGQRERR